MSVGFFTVVVVAGKKTLVKTKKRVLKWKKITNDYGHDDDNAASVKRYQKMTSILAVRFFFPLVSFSL